MTIRKEVFLLKFPLKTVCPAAYMKASCFILWMRLWTIFLKMASSNTGDLISGKDISEKELRPRSHSSHTKALFLFHTRALNSSLIVIVLTKLGYFEMLLLQQSLYQNIIIDENNRSIGRLCLRTGRNPWIQTVFLDKALNCIASSGLYPNQVTAQ